MALVLKDMPLVDGEVIDESIRAKNGRTRLPPWEFSGIYAIQNKLDGKIYVGQSVNIRRRIISHRNKYDRALYPRSYFYHAVRAHGWANFEIRVVERVEPEMLDDRERYWIREFEATDPFKGYNIRADPVVNRGWKHSEETRKKQSVIKKAKGDAKFPWGDGPTPQEIREKITETRRRNRENGKRTSGFNGSKKKSIKVAQIDISTGETLYIWQSVMAAARFCGIAQGNLDSILKDPNKSGWSLRGYDWKIAIPDAVVGPTGRFPVSDWALSGPAEFFGVRLKKAKRNRPEKIDYLEAWIP